MTWRSVDRAGLLDASGNDPYVELTCGDVAVGVVGEHGWACLHRWRPTGHWGGAAMVHEDAPQDAESTALRALLDAVPQVALEWFSTADGRGLQLPEKFRVKGSGRWNLLSTRSVPPQVALPEGFALVELDDTVDADRLEAFGRRHNPDFEGFPGHGFSMLWLGVLDDMGRLAAIGSLHELDTGLPHLSGIVVDRARRGRGLGRAVTVGLTRRALGLSGVSTLGVYADNRVAISLYHSLGYETHHSFHTRDVQPA
ncbi:MAG TPA: GNAT family N-acetyltransferase [Ornithinicoccus sp.]|nr:GNAT family N-acetyltransferase [Ornithinicoccus sp.]